MNRGRSQHAYFYWRCAAEDAEAALSALAQWQAELKAAHPGLACERWRRVDEASGQATLMEVYGPLSAAANWRALLVDEGAQRTAAWRQGERHLELFENAN